ncbi:MAG: Gldg family protein [Lachnospiraceae bacterium]|nr:Gldg family protein [Lachnospiraceae bacterium]
MLAIFKRELRACFTGITGWLFMAVVLALFGLYFFVYNMLSGYPYVSYTLSSMAFIMLIAVPILTMRIISEDRRSRADQLILTAPVSVWKIVFGKFLALGALFTIDMLIISVTPLVMSLYGTVPMGESYTAILGFWLYGLACIAIGVFVSGLTESQIIAAVLCFVILFLGYMMNNICTLISESGNIVTKILGCYDLYSALGPFMAGTLDLTCVVYLITVILVALLLAVQIIEKRRWSMSVRHIGLGAFSIATIVTIVAAGVLINFGVRKIPTEYTSIDATYNGMFKLTDETREYVTALDQDIDIYVWSSEGQTDTTLKETLNRLEDLSPRLKVKYITPSEQPNFYSSYTTDEPTAGSMIVVSDQRSRVVDYNDIYEHGMDYQTYAQTIEAYDAEGQIISAIEYVTMDAEQMPKAYILEGHKETALGSAFMETLAKANITSDTLSLLKVEAVPDDCQLLIINGAMSDLSSDDEEKIHAYIENGGNVLLTTSYDAGHQPNVEKLLGIYGITKQDGIVMEYDAGHIYQKVAYYLLPEVVDSSYTGDIDNGYVFAPFAAGFTIDEDNADYEYTDILVTSDKAKAMTVNEQGEADENAAGVNGPFYIGVAVNKADEAGSLIVFGSMDVFNDDADEIVAGSNNALFKGIVSRHVNESNLDLPVIPSKQYTVSNLVISSATGVIVGVFLMLLIPIAMIASGIAIWGSRRKR